MMMEAARRATGSWEDQLVLFNAQSFLEEGAEREDWFHVPDRVRRMVDYSGDREAQLKLAKIQSLMEIVNQFLGRGDVSEAEKREMISRFMGNLEGDFDDEDDSGSIGRIFAGVMSEDEGALRDVLLTRGGLVVQELSLEELDAIQRTFSEDFRSWKEERQISAEKNREASRRLSALFERQKEARKNYSSMTIRELGQLDAGGQSGRTAA